MRAALAALVLASPAAALFGRPPRAEREVRAFYAEDVAEAFARQDAQAVAALYDPKIKEPMTQAAIRKWAHEFFLRYDEVRFHVDALAFEKVEPRRVVARLTYHVTTDYGKGDFGGTERAVLVKEGRRWRIASWAKGAQAAGKP